MSTSGWGIFPVILFDMLLETAPHETAIQNWEAGWVE